MCTLSLRHALAICGLTFSFSTPLLASNLDQLDRTGIKEEWGQVIFCQRIYKMPEVKSRLYDFDIEHCDQAGVSIIAVVSKDSEQDQAVLKSQAERHAGLLMQNTSEPYHAVTACRAFCQKLAGTQDKTDE